MSKWNVKSVGIHGTAVNAACYTGEPGSTVEIIWLGDAERNDKLRPILDALTECVVEHLEKEFPAGLVPEVSAGNEVGG